MNNAGDNLCPIGETLVSKQPQNSLQMVIFYRKIQMEHFCEFSNTVHYLLRRRLLRRNAFCLSVLVPPPPVL